MAVHYMAIDPGSRRVGWACLVELGPEKGYRLFSGTMKTKADKEADHDAPLWLRMSDLAEQFKELLDKYRPDSLVFERPIASQPATAVDIISAYAVLRWVALENGFRNIPEIPASTVKKAVTGRGNCKKKELRQAVEKFWNTTFKTHDESDAVAIVTHYLFQQRAQTGRIKGHVYQHIR